MTATNPASEKRAISFLAHGGGRLGLACGVGLLAAVGVFLIAQRSAGDEGQKQTPFKINKPDSEWRKQLTKEQFHVTRQKGTERAFSGALWKNHDAGDYTCVCCGEKLFSSQTKFESGTGWPSFYQPLDPQAVREEKDESFMMERTEVMCENCGAHLGHVFNDGPKPTGLRYCINSASLKFEKDKAKAAAKEAKGK